MIAHAAVVKILFVSFFLVVLFSSLEVTARSTSCGPLYPPKRGGFSCTRGSKFGSKCTLKCAHGYIDSKLAENHGRHSSRICSCSNGICFWDGAEFECQEFKCPHPNFVDGKLMVVDQWKEGFNAVVEFSNIPVAITDGWSVKVFFDPPLGVNTEISSWSSVLSSSTLPYDGLTLVNVNSNADITEGYDNKSYLRISFIADKIADDFAYRRVYVGLYNERLLDLNCFVPALTKLKVWKVLPIFTQKDVPVTTVPVATTTPVTTEAVTEAVTQPITTKAAEATTPQPDVTTKVTEPETTTTNEEEEEVEEETEEETEEESEEEEEEEEETNAVGAILTERVDGKRCRLQTDNTPYNPQRGWKEEGNSFYSILAKVSPKQPTPDWLIVIVFGAPVKFIEVWNTNSLGGEFDGKLWKFGALSWNRNLPKGNFDMSFNAKFSGVMPYKPNGRVYLCSSAFTTGEPVHEIAESSRFISEGTDQVVSNGGDSSNSGEENKVTTPTTQAPIITAKPLTEYKTKRCKSPINGNLPTNPKQTKPKWKKHTGKGPDYNEVLHKSLLFYDAQRAGVIPKFNRVPWRGDSTLRDGCDYGIDLSGGWFDAGDTVKFTFPFAATLTNLMWGGIVYENAYKDSANYPHLLQSLRSATTWLMRAHPKRYELVVMVGDPKADHGFWGRPEELNMPRPVYKIDKRNPGTEVAAESAAALAAASIIFQKSYKNLAKAALKHAEGLYDFATRFKGDYHNAVPLVKDFYKSWSGYDDEVLWAAAWLYKATGKKNYLDQAKKQYTKMRGQYLSEREVSWDKKTISAQILLANLTGEDIFRNPIDRFMTNVMKMPTTPEGIMYLNEWAPNRYAANAAMIAILASDISPPLAKSDLYFQWGQDQLHRIMGLKGGRSYIIGVGKNWPKRPHHRSSSCPLPPAPCTYSQLGAPGPNPMTLFGALVGGPGLTGKFPDDRADYRANEVALDYNAGFQTAIAGLKHHQMKSAS